MARINETTHPVVTVRDEVQELGWPPRVYPYISGVIGGFLGGLVMIVPAVAYGWLSGYGPWLPVNLIAATVTPSMQNMTAAELAAFDPLALIFGLTIHIIMATLLGLVLAVLLPTLPGNPLLWSLVIGPLLWLGATAVILPQVNPIMSNLLDFPSFAIANIAYGIVLGLWVASTPRIRADRVFQFKMYWPTFIAPYQDVDE